MKPDQQYVHVVLEITYVDLNVNFYSVDEVLWFDHWFGLLCLFVCLNQKMTFRILFSLFNLRTIKTETVTNCIRKIRQSALMNSMYFSSQEHSLSSLSFLSDLVRRVHACTRASSSNHTHGHLHVSHVLLNGLRKKRDRS